MADTLKILTLVLGSIQIVDIFVSLGLYYAYDKNSDYLWMVFTWFGMSLFFITDTILGSVSLDHIFNSYIFAGITGVSMGEIIARQYGVPYSWKKASLWFLTLVMISFILKIFGVTEFWFLGLLVGLGVVVPVLYSLFYAFENIKKMHPTRRSGIDYIFMVTLFVWVIHFLDYPFLRPMENLRISIFGFSFALILTYLTSILLPVVVNRRFLLGLNDTLEGKLVLRTQQLNKAQTQIIAREKLASLGSLAAGIAHEIKNPLNIIKNGAFLLSNYVNKDLKEYHHLLEKGKHEELSELIVGDIEKLASVASLVDRNVGRADNIVKSMLEQSRTGHSVLTKEDLNRVIMDSLEFVIESTKGKYDFQVQTEFHLSAVNHIFIYNQDFSRALINIIDNSLYAMNQKYLKASYIPKIQVSTVVEGAFIRIEIEDNGIGIAGSTLKNILNPFFTTKPSGEGTGLGLSMVFDVVKLHEGEIEFFSEENEFTKVIFKINRDLNDN
ncbi:MAG: signal transduction histidine kinase [Bacteriovoracaceae bacterium]|jgi:signal transduction histidine kinase